MVLDAGRFQPKDEDGLFLLAERFYRSGFLPDAYYPKEAKQRWEKWPMEQGITKAYLAMLKGAAMGILPSEAIWQIHIINNRPSPSADLMWGRMLAMGILRRDDFTIQANKTYCKLVIGVKTRAAAERIEIEAKHEDFKHLHSKDNWKNHPEDMLVARAKARACRRYAPDIFAGVYSIEEMRDMRADQKAGVYEVPDAMMPQEPEENEPEGPPPAAGSQPGAIAGETPIETPEARLRAELAEAKTTAQCIELHRKADEIEDADARRKFRVDVLSRKEQLSGAQQ